MTLFNELKPSLEEAVEIHQGRNPTGLAAKVLATIQDNPNFYQELSAH